MKNKIIDDYCRALVNMEVAYTKLEGVKKILIEAIKEEHETQGSDDNGTVQ